MTSGVGFGNVANFSYTYPGLSLGVVSDANNGYGSALGDGDVIVYSFCAPYLFSDQFAPMPTPPNNPPYPNLSAVLAGLIEQ